MLRGDIFVCLESFILSFTCNFFAYFKFHSDWERVISKIKQNELDCRDTAPLIEVKTMEELFLRLPNGGRSRLIEGGRLMEAQLYYRFYHHHYHHHHSYYFQNLFKNCLMELRTIICRIMEIDKEFSSEGGGKMTSVLRDIARKKHCNRDKLPGCVSSL